MSKENPELPLLYSTEHISHFEFLDAMARGAIAYTTSEEYLDAPAEVREKEAEHIRHLLFNLSHYARKRQELNI